MREAVWRGVLASVDVIVATAVLPTPERRDVNKAMLPVDAASSKSSCRWAAFLLRMFSKGSVALAWRSISLLVDDEVVTGARGTCVVIVAW